MAALTSRSKIEPQLLQVHLRSFKVRYLLMLPQLEQVLLDGSKRPMRIMFLPYQSALYSNCRTNSPQLASIIAWANLWFCNIPLIFKSSMQIVSWFLISSLEVLCKKSFRWFATISCSLCSLCFVRLPFFFEYLRCTYFNLDNDFLRNLGLSNPFPPEETRKVLMPKSMPMDVFSLIAFLFGNFFLLSVRIDTKYLPVGVLLMVACLISPFISRCNVISIPFRNLGITNLSFSILTFCGIAKDCFVALLLKLGKSACPLKNLVKAVSKLTIDCCRDWLLISLSQIHSVFKSGSCFTKSKHEILIRLLAYAICLHSKAKLYTNRQLPICLFINSACAFVGEILYLYAFNTLQYNKFIDNDDFL